MRAIHGQVVKVTAVSCGVVFEKLKREAEAEDAKKAELWAQVFHSLLCSSPPSSLLVEAYLSLLLYVSLAFLPIYFPPDFIGSPQIGALRDGLQFPYTMSTVAWLGIVEWLLQL